MINDEELRQIFDREYPGSVAQNDRIRWNAFKRAYTLAHNAQQAKIDRLMFEYCPGEMTVVKGINVLG